MSIRSQIRALSHGVDILIGTPGRLFDLMQERALRLDAVEIFVLDEADRMLDMGFIHAIRKIAAATGAQVVASGGAGKLEHFLEAVEAGATILLAASVFHFNLIGIPQLKRFLSEKGVKVRNPQP